MYQLNVVGIYGALEVGRKSGKSSVFSLFNLKEKSRFWTESVIRSGIFLWNSLNYDS